MAATSMCQRRRVRWAAAGFLGVLVGLLTVPLQPAAPAHAHATLVRTNPAVGAIIDSLPAEVVLTFSEPVRPVPSRIRLVGPDGGRLAVDSTRVGTEVRMRVRANGAGPSRGTYLVSYRVVSTDSHPLGGAFTFSVGDPSAAPAAEDTAGTDPVVVAGLGAARFAGYAGLVLLVGPTIALFLFWPHRLSRRGPARLVVAGLGLVAAATVLELSLEVPYSTGEPVFGGSADAYRDLLLSQYGLAHEMRLAVLVSAAVLLPAMLRSGAAESGSGGPPVRLGDQVLLVFLTVVGLATWPLSGHAVSSVAPLLTVAADMAHLAAVCFWLGGLATLIAFVVPRATVDELDTALPIWSRWAACAVGVLVAAGLVQAVLQIHTLEGLLSTAYGRLVLTKVGLLALILVAAAYARRLVHRGGDAGEGRRRKVFRAVLVELVLLTVVMGVSAALVQTPPANTAPTAAQAGSYEVRLASELYLLQVYLSPAQSGDNTVSLFAFTPTNAPLAVVEWNATATLAAEDLGPIIVPLARAFDGHAVGRIRLPQAGAWEFRFTLRTSDVDQASVVTTVPIELYALTCCVT
jgi:copper transport protein